MQFAAEKGAARVLTVWISAAGIASTAFVSALAGLITPWLIVGSVLTGVITVFAALWYPARFAESMRGEYDGVAVRAASGVFQKKRLFIPMKTLRTFELSSTPVQRLFGCRTIILRFAGGAAILPLLPVRQAEALIRSLELYED